MDPSDALQLVILIVLVLLSAFFSCSETALTSISRIRILTLLDEDNHRASRVKKLLDMQPKMLSTILIGNNIVNLSASAISTMFATQLAEKNGISGASGSVVGIATGILTLVILIFGEITPKNMATVRAESISLMVAPVILALIRILTPVVFIINALSGLVMKLLGIKPEESHSIMTEGDLRTVIDVSHQDGVLESEEKEIITNVVDFGDSLVSSVMIPRIDVKFIDADSSYEDTLAFFRAEKYSRIPVYNEDKDHVEGILNLKDFFCYDAAHEDFNIRNIMRQPYFTYEFKKTSDLMIEMQNASINMEIVLDEFGEVAGIITLEDLLEEIVGEIRDEYDEEETDDIQKISENELLVDGNTRLEDINELLGLELESDDYESIAGHMINELEHIPEEGEQINIHGITFTIIKMDNNRIETIKVVLPNRDN